MAGAVGLRLKDIGMELRKGRVELAFSYFYIKRSGCVWFETWDKQECLKK